MKQGKLKTAQTGDPKVKKVERITSKRKIKGSDKGALIKGMTKRLPHEILDNPLFQIGLRRIMRGRGHLRALQRIEALLRRSNKESVRPNPLAPQGSSCAALGQLRDIQNQTR